MSGPQDSFVDCGWGRLIFGQTFARTEDLVSALREEGADRRDIAFYISDPHVVLAHAPQDLFLDPSHTFRLDLAGFETTQAPSPGFRVRRIETDRDATEMNRLYRAHRMVEIDPSFFQVKRGDPALAQLVAEDETTGAIIGTVSGVDHAAAFGDPERGSSLWCLAVDAQAVHAGIGAALVRALAAIHAGNGAVWMDLSVMHDNAGAIGLYEKLGFRRVPFFAVKRRNAINERLYVGPAEGIEALNPYARIIVDEARRRGIHAEVTDAEGGFFRLTYGGRSIHCRESLSELTSGVAVSICDDKAVTRRIVESAGVTVPEQIVAGDDDAALAAFIEKHRSIVVKPARGEQGRGVAVGIDTVEEAKTAIAVAREQSDRVLLEACFEGDDLRLVVIDFRLVAAALRRPPTVTGDGKRTVRDLIEHQSRRRASATGGESRIPLDGETERCLRAAGFALEDVLPEGERVTVRKTANLHTGGTIHDVTGEVHPTLVEAACRAARAIDIPVCGVDFMVKDPRQPDYIFVEANERPGLANHEPQPTVERFVDLLFPLSLPREASRVRDPNRRRRPLAKA